MENFKKSNEKKEGENHVNCSHSMNIIPKYFINFENFHEWNSNEIPVLLNIYRRGKVVSLSFQ